MDIIKNFFILYGIFNLGFHISMVLISNTIITGPSESSTELDSESEPCSEPGSEPESEPEPDSDYIQPSELKMNLRKRKTI